MHQLRAIQSAISQRLRVTLRVTGERRSCSSACDRVLCPVGPGVDVERDQFHRAVRRELANNGVGAHDDARRDQDSVVVSARDQGREYVEVDSELLHDVEELECLEVARRWLAIRSSFAEELTIEIAERSRASHEPRGVRRSPGLRFGLCDALFSSRSRPLDEVLRRVIQIRDDARLEQRMALSRAHLLELRGSHDISGHIGILPPVPASGRARSILPVLGRVWGQSNAGDTECPPVGLPARDD